MKLSTISKDEMDALALVADLAWRGISYPPCGQLRRTEAPIQSPDQGYWGRANGETTDLEATLKSAAR